MNGGWVEVDGALQKRFVFGNFKQALEFVNRVGDIAESLQHHPDIAIQNYNEVLVSTTTHDAGNTVTEKDRMFSDAVERINE